MNVHSTALDIFLCEVFAFISFDLKEFNFNKFFASFRCAHIFQGTKTLSSFTHHYILPNQDFISSAEHKKKSSYNESQYSSK